MDPLKSPSHPTVIFIHHFGGSEASTKRHALALKDLGFESRRFNLSWHGTSPSKKRPLPLQLLKKWARETEGVMNSVRGPKILYGFSGPSAISLTLAARRTDVVGIVCDSGPFTDPWTCTRTMIQQVWRVRNPVLRETILAAMMLAWGLDYKSRLFEALETLKKNRRELRILSFRGLQDLIVPPEQTAEVFARYPELNLTTVNLDTGHLTGLRDQRDIYIAALREFLAF